MKNADLTHIYQEVLPWARAGQQLPESHAQYPAYAAAFALWSLILYSPHPATKLAALKEYHDRVMGKAGEADGGDPFEEYDFDALEAEELAELERLLEKARRKKGGD